MGLCGSQLSPEDQAEKGNDKKLEQALRDQQAADAKINERRVGRESLASIEGE
jgi:hypothetical protein